MKKILSLALILITLFHFNLIAKEAKVRDKTTKPDFYFLKRSEVVNSFNLLPPPPEIGSIMFLNDQAMYEKGLLLRDTPRGKQASLDSEYSPQGISAAFSEAFGYPINQKDSPEIYKLLTNMLEDAGDLATIDAKEGYKRIRPFAFYKTNTCNTKDQKNLSTNGSYPSGHTSLGWATALVLAEINPDNQEKILKRGYEMGQSRVICGYHWQSDVDAARLVASAVVSTLHANKAFQTQLAKAKAEFAKIRAKK